MVDVDAYHMLHHKDTPEATDKGSLISDASVDLLRNTEEFLVQLPPTIEGFNMTEKKWSMLYPHFARFPADTLALQYL